MPCYDLQIPMFCRNYSKYNQSHMCRDLESEEWNALYDMTDVNRAWTFFKDILTTVYNKHAPKITKRVKGRHCPWLTQEVKGQINHKDQFLRKARRSKNKND